MYMCDVSSSQLVIARQNAYHPGTNPSQTSSDLANLKHLLLKVIHQSGVRALPLLALPSLQGMDAAMSVGKTLPGLDATNTGAGGIASIQVPSGEKLFGGYDKWD